MNQVILLRISNRDDYACFVEYFRRDNSPKHRLALSISNAKENRFCKKVFCPPAVIAWQRLQIFLRIIFCCGVLFLFPPTCYAQEQPLGAAGQTFEEISQGLIHRLESYYIQNGKYASAEGNSRFEDIGLNPQEWEDKVFDGVVFDPRGNHLEARPAQDYTFFVNQIDGETRILSFNLGWSLVYNLQDKTWYFHRADPSQIIDIKSLRAKKDKPYNPEEYR